MPFFNSNLFVHCYSFHFAIMSKIGRIYGTKCRANYRGTDTVIGVKFSIPNIPTYLFINY